MATPRDADAPRAQSLFARVAAAPGTGRPCGKETRPAPIPFGGAPPPPAPGTGGSSGGCPVVGDAPPQRSGGCPVIAGDSPANNMPATPNNAPAPGQRAPLPTDRVASSIPTVDAADLPGHQAGDGTAPPPKTWLYPSPQMFFNAMRRKGWTPDEADMPSVVAIHNAVNERAWADVVAWEARAGGRKCGGPRLVRFEGRPRDVSPKARLLNMLGYRLPFDRHDWYVDRCGTTVRYVIDFYNAAPPSPTPAAPGAPPPPVAMHLDVRPALDSPGALWQRVKAQAAWVASGRWRE